MPIGAEGGHNIIRRQRRNSQKGRNCDERPSIQPSILILSPSRIEQYLVTSLADLICKASSFLQRKAGRLVVCRSVRFMATVYRTGPTVEVHGQRRANRELAHPAMPRPREYTVHLRNSIPTYPAAALYWIAMASRHGYTL